MYVNMATAEVMTEKELRDIFREQYDGDDPTNAITFDEWLNGMHYEEDINGKLYQCVYVKI